MRSTESKELYSSSEYFTQHRLFSASNSEDIKLINLLSKENPQLKIVNTLKNQLKELVKITFPSKKYTDKTALNESKKLLKNKSFQTYGNWVHYPWLNTLVRVLPEDDFIKVRTSRNHYKITPEEQAALSTKKVGVIGLSVGQSIAITMASERIFGELRIADFDELELSNLNRIRSGIQNLGTSKVAIVAREIAEIDPYLKIKCFWKGINEENIDQFLNEDEKLDLIADECDDIYLKFLIRQKAKHFQIPVVMDTSDRGMIDIERFDLEPERKIFHGLVEHLDVNGAKNLVSNEDKVTYALPIVGIKSASSRIKASMLEIGQTISTWPQLSSDVTLGGAISTNVIRRIFLGHHSKSGRFYADMSELLSGNRKKEYNYFNFSPLNFPLLNIKEIIQDAIKIQLLKGRIRARKQDEEEILNSAISAPSGANCQPWKWLVKDDAYFLFHEKHFSISFNDFEDSGSHLAMGCAVENFIRAADKLEYNRKTNRIISKRKPIDKEKLNYLKDITSATQGAELKILTEKNQLQELGELISISDKIRVLHPQCHYELFKKELRKTEEENLKFKDGIDLELMHLSAADRLVLDVASDYKVIEHLNCWNKGFGFTKLSEKTIEASSALCLISMPNNSALDFFRGGRAVQNTWLAATKLNLAFQPLTVLPYFFHRLNSANGKGFKDSDIDLLRHLWIRFNALFPSSPQQGLVFLFRLAIANEPQKSSLRRNYHDFVHVH